MINDDISIKSMDANTTGLQLSLYQEVAEVYRYNTISPTNVKRIMTSTTPTVDSEVFKSVAGLLDSLDHFEFQGGT